MAQPYFSETGDRAITDESFQPHTAHPLVRLLRYAWAAPTTAVGLLMVAVTLVTGGGVQVVDGVLEAYGGFTRFFLTRCTLIRGGASVMTLGHVILGRDQGCLELCREHEHVHVRQVERWGPLFIPAYLLFSLWAGLRGRDPYRQNRFEREAYGDV